MENHKTALQRAALCNVLFVVPSLKRGGAEMQLIELLRRIDPDRFNVILYTFDDSPELLNSLAETTVQHVHQRRRFKLDFLVVRRIRELIDTKEISVIHTTLEYGLLIAWLGRIGSRRRPALINALHRTVARDRKQEIQERFVYQWPMRNCKRVICVCRSQKEYWEQRFPFLRGRTRVVYNGVDADRFDPGKFRDAGTELRAGMGIPPGAFVATSVAGLRPEKNHVGLLEAFERLDRDGLDLYLFIVGDGQERPRVEKFVHEHGLGSRVRLLGEVRDVRPVLAASDLSVIASTAVETFSVAMLESMAMAVPVVTTDIGGQKEAISDGETGAVVAVNRPDKLSEAISGLLQDPSKLKIMGRQARERVVREFSVDKMVRETEQEIEAAWMG